MSQANLSTRLSDLRSLLTRDPKKTLILGSLVIVLCVLWGRMVLTGSTRPTAASGAVRSGGATSSHPPMTASQPVLSSGQSALQHWLAEAPQPITRNLFAVKFEYFPTDASRFVKGANAAPEGFWTQLEKSLAVQADQSTKRENLIANLRTLASGLRLESTFMGTSPKAMINGALVGEGDVVATFRVVGIDPRRIIVEREGIRLEIQMK